jgi:hypothetical protein
MDNDPPKFSMKPAAWPQRLRKSKVEGTPQEWAARRCRLACQSGRDTLNGKTPPPEGTSKVEHALLSLLDAVEELAIIQTPISKK